MEQKSLIARCEKLMDDLGIPKSAFCKRIRLSTSAFYAWKSGALKLSDNTASRVSEFLDRFGY